MPIGRIFSSSFGCAMLLAYIGNRLGLDDSIIRILAITGMKFGYQISIRNQKKEKKGFQWNQ